MLLIHCPYCQEERPELEFRNARRGAYRTARPTSPESATRSSRSSSSYRDNPKGVTYERWRHIHGCARFFNAVRDTVTDKFVTTYKAGEPRRRGVAWR
jgi:sarcosine oxidase subunit delta